jgi:probable H4MPT-linked C1 transfer pathway protein
MITDILGWDVGGANIKVARIDPRVPGAPAVIEQPFPLWRDFDRLPSMLAELGGRIVGAADVAPPVMAITMTAELADCFATKREGVAFLVSAFARAFPRSIRWVFATDGTFRSAEDARQQPHDVAAANWMATAMLVARTHADALLVDVGSTTTDIVPIAGGRVVAAGRTDPARLRSGELVYTGVLRTPVCAVIRSVPLEGGRSRVAAEHFAIAADAYRWLGKIQDGDYTCETPDGRGRTADAAGARLARMVCADRETIDVDDVTAIAVHVADTQSRQIAHAIRQVLRRRATVAPQAAVVAGAGAFLARAAAEAAGLAVRDLAAELGSAAARAAPAAAVAHLLADMLCTPP